MGLLAVAAVKAPPPALPRTYFRAKGVNGMVCWLTPVEQGLHGTLDAHLIDDLSSWCGLGFNTLGNSQT